MEYEYLGKVDGTNLVKTGILMAVIAAGVMPSANYSIPQQTSMNFEEYAETNTQSVIASNSRTKEDEQIKILLSFADKLAGNTKDLDIEVAQIISNDFWEMYDRF